MKGATYGPFPPDESGSEYHTPEVVERDFAQMTATGVNTVRTYTVPPRWLLNIAVQYGLRVMVGIPWEQHITFLDDPRTVDDIEARIERAVEGLAGHPAVLCFSIGNEIPAAIVRWYGRKPVERLLERFYRAAKRKDPDALVTYVNYPSTEYLTLPFLDLLAFNVYLESPQALSSYLARLQNIAGDRPLLMAEVGLDSLRHGQSEQASVLEWQIRLAFAEGAAGIFVFSWTDEWYRGGQIIRDWEFGLTTVDRRAKPALAAVARAFQFAPLRVSADWPLVTVVICTYNGGNTIRETLGAVKRLEYARGYEVIVIDDGSTDATASIVKECGVRMISIRNGGLSNARNVGWRNASGRVVAYLDDDACPDPHWLSYLVSALLSSDFAGIGGPNIAPPHDGFIACCVDHSPGNPTHVLIDDRRAEHVPGCNMAFWRDRIESVGGFDATFRIAGDDVDFCWRLQEQGWALGFAAGAVVWHHRRGTVRTYWKQQMNYGRAEAMLERKWPAKYNAVGHLNWSGRVYAKAVPALSRRRQRIYHGTWGTAAFQSIYNIAPSSWTSVLAMPEWYLLLGIQSIFAFLGLLYPQLAWASIGLGLTVGLSVGHALAVVRGIPLQLPSGRRWERMKHRLVITGLHLMQPAARLWGRLSYGLTPWRRRGTMYFVIPLKRLMAAWHEEWRSAEERLKDLEDVLRSGGTIVARGGDFDAWDLEIRGGWLGDARLVMTIEEHGQGRQFVRVRVWPTGPKWTVVAVVGLISVALGVILKPDLSGWVLLGMPTCLLLARCIYETGAAIGAASHAFAVSSSRGGCTDEGERVEPAADANNGYGVRQATEVLGRLVGPTGRDGSGNRAAIETASESEQPRSESHEPDDFDARNVTAPEAAPGP